MEMEDGCGGEAIKERKKNRNQEEKRERNFSSFRKQKSQLKREREEEEDSVYGLSTDQLGSLIKCWDWGGCCQSVIWICFVGKFRDFTRTRRITKLQHPREEGI